MEMAKSAYCKSCAGNKFADDGSATMKVVPPPVSIMAPVMISSDDVKPSALFSSRARPLPRFGGSKTCPACHQTINLLEEKNGPMASKWHKKCLKCESCSKALDSSAIMKDNGKFTSLVCRSCHVSKSAILFCTMWMNYFWLMTELFCIRSTIERKRPVSSE